MWRNVMAVIWKINKQQYKDAGERGGVQFLTEARLTFRLEYAADMILTHLSFFNHQSKRRKRVRIKITVAVFVFVQWNGLGHSFFLFEKAYKSARSCACFCFHIVSLCSLSDFRLNPTLNSKLITLVETWNKLYHPNIVQLREAFTTKAFGDNCK